MASKGELLEFLNKRVFDPILRENPDKYKEDQRNDLLYVQRATRDEKERYEHYENAQKVVEMFKDDLRSANAKPVVSKLKRLGLPSLPDVQDDFLKRAS